ncbi:MAG: glutathione S-transferase N-terminal domain-containing protein [Tepidiphilus sp.]|jgi:RNA polymerase-associated protein|uniref:Glutathione S-transferase n=1 Tax=Tepidiphilus thermophilus TaxID=876478 RepID=A0A0K6IVH7_9PROT|nr:glutathione S-transferase N-terminal domain-containing protein [Tepidiphilus succinatimandens]MBP6998407.1 glutathione S-transferase N-terminal domain-containing protein [Tepidiphilus sp.]MDK2797139.1 stringent starvation protein [Tepidiphilus sp.]CUB07352.1 Glutathione S-transferase [Tepidiphilus thermophilus]
MMNLYSGSVDPFSHRCRIVLYEKGMDFEVTDVDLLDKQADVARINPYGRVPVLVDRELVLFEPNIINEYIDERFPHPQLMPPDPILRARARQLLQTLENELFRHMRVLEEAQEEAPRDQARQTIRDQLVQLAPILNRQKYLFGEDYSMIDVAMAPLLWRLEHYGIALPAAASPIMKYAERLFSRQGFIDALSPAEKLMRK